MEIKIIIKEEKIKLLYIILFLFLFFTKIIRAPNNVDNPEIEDINKLKKRLSI